MRTQPPVRPEPRTRTLTAAPSLVPLLARGALLSPLKRPRPDAPVPATRLVLPGVRIDLAHLAAYERACGFPTGADALPLTYPHVLAFPLAMRIMAGRAFPLPLLGLVHTSIGITRHEGAGATREYELAVEVGKLAPHRRGTEATVLTEARAGGRLVWESTSTYLARHRHRPGTPDEARPEAGGDGSREGNGDGNLRHETSPSAPLPSPDGPAPLPAVAEWPLAADVGRRYAAVSGDRNPIHLHPLTARLFGFPRAIAHGMWTLARCLAEYGPRQAVEVQAEFRAPVLLPGTVTYAERGPSFELRSGGRVHLRGEVRTHAPDA
ncbi:MaoC family dehydratase [Streptomyces aureus]|uniref:MaoC family dehydratase n=1 Tax=Streptomyces aureus TaxID=193461 RepID=UPI00368746DC